MSPHTPGFHEGRGGPRYRGSTTRGFSRPSRLQLSPPKTGKLTESEFLGDITYTKKGRPRFQQMPQDMVPPVPTIYSARGKQSHPTMSMRPQLPFTPQFGNPLS